MTVRLFLRLAAPVALVIAWSAPVLAQSRADGIADFCACARSLHGTPRQRPDAFGVAITPHVAAVHVNLTVPLHVGAPTLTALEGRSSRERRPFVGNRRLT